MKKPKKDMAKELKKWKNSVYLLNKSGQLIKTVINNLSDYNHSTCHLHHYIEYQEYVLDPQWYEDRNIQQKLILMSIECHEQLHNNAIRNLTDEQFKAKYKISRWKLKFNRKYSNYE